MSKLFLLISLMSFISIKAFAMTFEQTIKANCLKQTGSYGNGPNSPYQRCLRSNGIVVVDTNKNSSDGSKGDAAICNINEPICKSCVSRYQNGSSKDFRTNVSNCIAADADEKERKKRPADAEKKKQARRPKVDPEPVGSEIVVTSAIVCSKQAPFKCKTEETCKANNGQWNGKACDLVACPVGTAEGSANLCVCNSDPDSTIERGTTQRCASDCTADKNLEYDAAARSCSCKDGFEDPNGTMAKCVAKNTAPAKPLVAECLRELQDKVNSCDSSASSAVDKCDSKKKKGDTIDTLQSLLSGATRVLGALDNCSNAAVAGSTGYHALDALRTTCDSQIGSCKSDCSDANAMLTSDKDRIYEACRKKAWDDHSSSISGRSTPGKPVTEAAFNTEWDATNKGPFEQQIQQLQTKVNDNSAKCESGGAAVANREEMSGYMGEMDTAFKSASQCECQLSSAGTNCNNIPGPADCAADPTLAGCVRATINCLSPTDTSAKCVCFKNPNSDECKNTATASKTLPMGTQSTNAFTGVGVPTETIATPVTGFANSPDLSGKISINDNDLNGFNDSTKTSASGTSTGDGSSIFGSAQGGGGGQASGGGGGGSDSAAKSSGEGDGSENKGLRGLLQLAKGAIGNFFNKNNGRDKSSSGGSGEQKFDANGNPINTKNWRPRGMLRGLAGADDESIGGKYNDIWKVMNKQYKVQDQKDTFIFGGEKN